MIICCRCNRPFRLTGMRNVGVYVRIDARTLRSGDRLTCDKCGAEVIGNVGDEFREPPGGVRCEVDLTEVRQ